MEHVAEQSDLVLHLGDDEKVRDRYGQVYEVAYLDLDAPEQVLFECLEQIWQAWEKAFPDEAHLAHAAGGFWLRFWVSPALEFVSKLAAEGRSDDLRQAAADYIDAGFGEKRGPRLEQDGQSSAAARHLSPVS